MRFFYSLILTAFALVFTLNTSQAATVKLGPDECGIVKQCIDIPNDAGIPLALYGAPQYPFFFLYVGDVQYRAAQASGYSGVQVPLMDAAGDVVYLSYSFSTYVTCVRSGRGQHCSTHWVLNSGGTLDGLISTNAPGKFY